MTDFESIFIGMNNEYTYRGAAFLSKQMLFSDVFFVSLSHQVDIYCIDAGVDRPTITSKCACGGSIAPRTNIATKAGCAPSNYNIVSGLKMQ